MRPRTLLPITVATLALVFTVVNAGSGNATGSTPDEAEIARVLALSDDVAYGEYLAGECAACHDVATAGTADDDAVPTIHGRDATDLVRALIEYRAGVRENTTMQDVAGTLGDEEIAVLAHYLAAQGR